MCLIKVEEVCTYSPTLLLTLGTRSVLYKYTLTIVKHSFLFCFYFKTLILFTNLHLLWKCWNLTISFMIRLQNRWLDITNEELCFLKGLIIGIRHHRPGTKWHESKHMDSERSRMSKQDKSLKSSSLQLSK